MDMHALIDASGVIADVVLWDGKAPDGEGGWSPPAGTTAVLIPTGSGAGKGWSYDAKANTFTAPASAAAPPLDLKVYTASVRYAKETAGIMVGTAQIATDRDSQGMITGMWAAAQINPQIQVSFKSTSGFVTIGAAQVAKIASAVASYVQACFTTEAQVVAGIAAGTVKATTDVDAAFSAMTVPSAPAATTSGTGASGSSGASGASGSAPSSGTGSSS